MLIARLNNSCLECGWFKMCTMQSVHMCEVLSASYRHDTQAVFACSI